MGIKSTIINVLVALTPSFIKHEINRKYKKDLNVIDPSLKYINKAYSQEGEDLVLDRFFSSKPHGFYVDIGAHHPFRFSNTYKFYKNGWRGINIDAMPGSMKLFNLFRPNDINIEVPVSDKKEILPYYIFNEPALNTFSDDEAKRKNGLGNYKIEKTIELQTLPLAEILDTHLPINKNIDFLSVDVEGLDLAVLSSNNWSKYRPEFILVESLRNNSTDFTDNEVFRYLKTLRYILIAKTLNTMIFKTEIDL